MSESAVSAKRGWRWFGAKSNFLGRVLRSSDKYIGTEGDQAR